MPMLSQPAFGPKLSIAFITGGTLVDVWTLVWRYTVAPEALSPTQRFWFAGLLLTGATFVVIGAFLGRIGRAARKAELPPAEATPAEASIQHAAAATPHPVAPGVAYNPAVAGPLAGNVMNPAAAVAAQPAPAMPVPQVRPAM